MSNRGKHPNSTKALIDATEKRKKKAKSVHMTLSPGAILRLDKIVKMVGKSRSGLIELLSEQDEKEVCAFLSRTKNRLI
jgi:hypothetical protein